MKKLTIVLCVFIVLLQCSTQRGVGGNEFESDEYDPECTIAGHENVQPTFLDKTIRRLQQTGQLKRLYTFFKNRMGNGDLGAGFGAAAIDPADWEEGDTFKLKKPPTATRKAYILRLISTVLGSGRTVVGYLYRYGFIAKVLNKSEFDMDTYSGGIPPCAITNAIREFQIFNNIEPADGKITKETLRVMAQDRCGNKDVKCASLKCLTEDRYSGKGENLRKRRYAVRKKKWKGSRSGDYNIAYYFENDYNAASSETDKTGHDIGLTPEIARNEVAKGLYEWTKYAGVNFIETTKRRRADVKILFGSYEHGEGTDTRYFDGQYGVLAHMYYPRSGKMHFDESENYTASHERPGINLQVVAAHEMGHGLGIEHSNVPGSLMSPFYFGWREQILRDDDVKAVRHLYGIGNGMVIPQKGKPMVAPEGLATGILEGQTTFIRGEDEIPGEFKDDEGKDDEGKDDGKDDEGKDDEGKAENVKNETVADKCATGASVTFQETRNLGHCIDSFTAGFADPDEDHIYLFYNENNYIRLESGHQNMRFPKVSQPETSFAEMFVSDKFPGLEGPYEAAVTDNANKISYFFVDDTVTTWDWSTDQVGSLDKEPIENTMFAGLPDTAIHAVAKYGDQFIFFCGDDYYIFTPDHEGEEHSVDGPYPATIEEERIASAFDSFYNGFIYTTLDSYSSNNIYNLVRARKVTTGATTSEEFEKAIVGSYRNIDMDHDTMFGWPCGLGFCGTEIDFSTNTIVEN